MNIRIQRVSDGLYSAELFNPSSNQPSIAPEWATPAPMHPHDLCRELMARGFDPSDISDAFEAADPDMSPTRYEHVPTVGEEVLVVNHLGSFVVEEVNAEVKTASLRVVRSGALINVEWNAIRPFDDETRSLFREIAAGGPVNNDVLRRFLCGRK